MHLLRGAPSTYILIIVAIFALLFLASVALSWTGPTTTPPTGNVNAPINTGTTDQTKNASLGVNGLAVFGNGIMSGSNRYLNWGSTSGSSGYGLRDNGGTIQYKNSGGNWTSLNTPLGWVVSGGNVYNTAYVDGSVGIGTPNPQQKLDVQGGAIRQVMNSSYDVWIQGGASTAGGDNRNLAILGEDEDSGDRLYVNFGGEYASGAYSGGYFYAPAFLYVSDERLKTDVQTLVNGVKSLMQLRPVSFTWKADPRKGMKDREGTEDIGFIAQEVESVIPEVVQTDVDGYKSVDYPKLVPLLVKAIQEQQADNERQQDEIEALRAELRAQR